MPDPAAQEVVPAAIVAQEIAPQNLDAQSTRLANEVREKLAEGNWREGLAKINNTTDIDYSKLAAIKAKFGVETNPQTGSITRTQTESNLLAEISTREALAKKFLEVGYDGLTGQERIDIRAQVIQRAKKIPALREQIARLQQAGRADAFADRYIQDPQFSAEFSAVLGNLLNTEFSNAAISKYEELEEEKILRDEAEAERASAETKLRLLESRMQSYETDPNGQRGTNLQRIEHLRQQGPTRQTDIMTKEGEVDQAKLQVTALEQELALSVQNIQTEVDALDDRITQLGNQLNGMQAPQNRNDRSPEAQNYKQIDSARSSLMARRAAVLRQRSRGDIEQAVAGARTLYNNRLMELNGLRAEEQELAELEKERNELPTQIENARGELRSKETAKRQADQKVNHTQRTYDTAKEEQLAAENRFTEEMRNVFGAAAERMIAAQLNEANSVFAQELTSAKETSKSDKERAFFTTLTNRWLGNERRRHKGVIGFRRTETYRPLNKATVLEDYSTLLSEGDIGLTRSLMEHTINPDTGQPFTDAEITKMMENKDFADKARAQSVKQLMARKAMLGGFTAEDAYIIHTSDWGKGKIREGLEQNKEFRQELEHYMGADALHGHGYLERVGQEMQKHPFLWTLLLGVPALMGAFSVNAAADALNSQR